MNYHYMSRRFRSPHPGAASFPAPSRKLEVAVESGARLQMFRTRHRRLSMQPHKKVTSKPNVVRPLVPPPFSLPAVFSARIPSLLTSRRIRPSIHTRTLWASHLCQHLVKSSGTPRYRRAWVQRSDRSVSLTPYLERVNRPRVRLPFVSARKDNRNHSANAATDQRWS